MQANLYRTKFTIGIIYCLFVLQSLVANAQTKIVGYINKQPIEQAELNREIANNRAETMNMLTQKYKLTDLSNFWSKEFEGEKASTILNKRAWKALVKAKVQEQLFSAQNLWPFKNYDDLKQKMDSVNVRRSREKLAGKVMYGPVTFSEKTFFDYTFSNAVIKTKEKLFPRPIAEDSLLKHFEYMKKTVYRNNFYEFEKVKNRIETSFIDQEYDKLIADRIASAQVTIK